MNLSQSFVKFIQSITQTDREGRQYYKSNGGWRRLKTSADYADLNRILDKERA